MKRKTKTSALHRCNVGDAFVTDISQNPCNAQNAEFVAVTVNY